MADPGTLPPEPDEMGIVAAFLVRYHEDHVRGVRRPLEEYQALFPGYEAAVAREHAALASGTGGTDALPPIGPYRLIRELGRGGQGEVFLAEDTRLRRRVALKTLRGLALDEPEALARFRREAEVASRLDHPGICTVYEAGLDQGLPWIAMRYVEGESLARKIADARERKGVASDPTTATTAGPGTRAEAMGVVRLLEEAARALHAAHEAGVIHRDLKPANIMVTPEGRPVLLDFGLAREVEGGSGPTLTRTGDLFGTPAYMAPEQIDPKRAPQSRPPTPAPPPRRGSGRPRARALRSTARAASSSERLRRERLPPRRHRAVGVDLLEGHPDREPCGRRGARSPTAREPSNTVSCSAGDRSIRFITCVVRARVSPMRRAACSREALPQNRYGLVLMLIWISKGRGRSERPFARSRLASPFQSDRSRQAPLCPLGRGRALHSLP